MSALSSDFYPPSNRRRCVKGRPSYTEPSDNILLSQTVNHDYNSNDSYSQNEYSPMETIEPEDVEEEPITIDLSAFLNENPLLAQSAFESSAENNVASTESSSQFRVTDCEVKPSEVHKVVVTDEACSADVNNAVHASSDANNVTSENTEIPVVNDIVTPVLETVKENCSSVEGKFTNISGASPEKTFVPEKIFTTNANCTTSKEITLNGKKTPIKKFTKAKPLGLSNPLKKYKNFMKSKDLNKTNEKVFGKYPLVKCEKLDIENFVKNNKIKVSNWPLYHTESSDSNANFNRNITTKRLSLTKASLKPKLVGTLKPKLIRKSISFNKCLNNSDKKSNGGGMFNSLDSVSKPVIIRTDSWKPEITNSSAHFPTFFKNLIKPPPVSPKSVLGDLLKLNMLNDQTVNCSSFSSPEKEIIEKIKGPIITNVTKFCKSTKNYQRIAPKPTVLSSDVANSGQSLSKPVVETLAEAVSSEYTVIEPYIEDPTSPQKPKPILTVPIEVIASPEKQNIIVHSSAITKTENSEKPVKTVKSVFLNGAFKQISAPTRIKKDICVKRSIPIIKRGIFKRKERHILAETAAKVSAKEKDEQLEEDSNVLQAKSAVVDAMQSALGQNIKKARPKIVKKESSILTSNLTMLGSSHNSALGSSSYNSILNDFIMSGFDDFEEPSDLRDDESNTGISGVLLTPSSETQCKINKVVEDTDKINKRKSKKHDKRHKYSDDSPHTSDTLSASECEDEKDCENVLKGSFSIKRAKLISSPDVLGELNSGTMFGVSKKLQKLDKPVHISVNSSHSTNFNSDSNKDFDSNHVDSFNSFSHVENAVISVPHTDIKNDTLISSDNDKLCINSALNETLINDTENTVLNKISKENDSLLKQEICTRTLRERKCSSTEVDKFSDNLNRQTQNRHSFEKTKSVKGSINSKLKIQKKTPPRSTAKVKIKRKSCKSEDIIQEINTITGGHLNLKKGIKKHKESESEDNAKNSDLANINSKDDSESNSSTLFQWNRHSPRSVSKKKRTLKVRIKRSKKKNGSSRLQMPLNYFTDVIENANSTSSVSENNIRLHSSFREGKGEKMGTPCKEGISSENSASISDCNMKIVETDEKCTLEEHLPAYAQEDSMVNSKTSSESQVASNNVNSDLNNAVSDSLLGERSSLANTTLHENCQEPKDEDDRSDDVVKFDNICKDSYMLENSKDDEKYCENKLVGKSVATKSENCLSESSSGALKENGKDATVECMSDIKSNSQDNMPQTDILNQNDNSEINMEITESNEITKDVMEEGDSKNISEIDFDDISKQKNTMDVADENNENVLEEANVDAAKQDEILNDFVEENISENIIPAVDVNDISVLESISSSESMIEKDEIMSFTETHNTLVENIDVDTDNEKSVVEAGSDSNLNNNQTDLCMNSNDKDEEYVQLSYSETSDSEQNEILPEKNFVPDNEESDSSVGPKKCPKIKISFRKNSGDSPDSLRNWFVSESKQSSKSDHALSGIKVPKISISDCVSNIIDMKKDVGLNADSTSSHDIESNCSIIPSDTSIAVDKPNYGVTHISFSDDKSLTDYEKTSIQMSVEKNNNQLTDFSDTSAKAIPIEEIECSFSDCNQCSDNNETSSEDSMIDEKVDSSFFDDDPLIDINSTSTKDLPTEKIDSLFFDSPLSDINDISDKDTSVKKVTNSFSDDNPLAEIDKILSKDMPSEKIDSSLANKMQSKDFSIQTEIDADSLIKEYPTDCERDGFEISSLTKVVTKADHTKTEHIAEVNKRKRGRPRAVSATKTLGSDVNKTKGVSQESSISETPISKGKKKFFPVSTSTPSTNRKKNYDPELVCVPFSMGWMREHVIRASAKDDRRASDIYYFTPDGTKLRSMPEIGAYLSKHSDIELSMKYFTFAKELIYRQPFEIERDARQTSKKVSIPAKKKTALKSPVKAAVPQEVVKRNLVAPTSSSDNKKQDKILSENTSPPFDPKKKIVIKRKSSLSKESAFIPNKKVDSVSDCKVSRSSKQKTLDEYVNSDNEGAERKSTRSSRKIVKKVPFDNSFENKFPKKLKPIEQQNSIEKIKVNVKNTTVESDSRNEKTVAKNHKSNSLIVHFPKVTNESEHLGKKVIDSSPFIVTKSNELVINKSVSANSMPNMSDQLCPVRTSNKSSQIQNRIKVKLAPRKYEPVLHKPCSKFCNFAYIREPSVKCSICLCLFHPECIPFKPTGDIKYACVPCVKTQMDRLEEESVDIFFPLEFDVGILYPIVSFHIVSDPIFDATFNKFYSPVDQSFVQSCEENNCQSAQPCSTKNFPYPNNVCNCFVIDKGSFNNVYQCAPRPKTNLWYPPMCYDRTGMTGHTGMRIVSAAFPVQRNATNNPNPFLANSGSCLQNFQNSYVHNQHSSQVRFQNTFGQGLNCDKLPTGSASAHLSSQQQMHKMIPVSSEQFHTGEIPSNSILSESNNHISQHFNLPSSISVLQSMLQINNQSCENSDRSNVSTIPVIKNDSSLTNCESKLKIDEVSFAANVLEAGSNNSLPQESSTVQAGMICKLLQSNRELSSVCSNRINVADNIAYENMKKGDSGVCYTERNKRKVNSSQDSGLKKLKCNESVENKISVETSSSLFCDKEKKTEHLATVWDINKFSQIFECLNFIFKFLNVCDLLRASLVCQNWKHLATQKLLWESVSFSGMEVKDWAKCCQTLLKYETKYIDFRGIHDQDLVSQWKSFSAHVHLLSEVEELIFEKVPPFVINKVADNLPQLKRLTCYCLTSVFTEPEIWSTPCQFELSNLRYLGRIEALKISSMGGIILKDKQQSLMPYLPNLTHVVLTGFKFNSYMNLECLSQQKQLITLELGDCIDIEPQIYGLLAKLINLENLCLQNGGNISDSKLPEAVSKMSRLRRLELMNFQISCHLSDVLKKKSSLQHFSVWPDNRFEAAHVNFNSFHAATACSNLKSICWGILIDDDDSVPNALELQDCSKTGSKVKKLSFEELFQALVKYYPGVKVEVKCLPRSIWSEFCSSRSFM